MTTESLPENIAAFKDGAANTNEKPIYLGNLMLFSDQDLTALKHNLVFTAVVSTVFAGMIGTISNPAIPLIWRALFLGIVLTGLHSACIAIWNVTQSAMQVHTHCQPKFWWHVLVAHPMWLCGVAITSAFLVSTYGPMVVDSLRKSCVILGIGA